MAMPLWASAAPVVATAVFGCVAWAFMYTNRSDASIGSGFAPDVLYKATELSAAILTAAIVRTTPLLVSPLTKNTMADVSRKG